MTAEAAQRGALVVAGTFTTDPLRASLEYWIARLGLDLDVHLAPFDQVFQEVTDPASEFGRNRLGCNVVLLRFEDWPSGDQGTRTVEDFITATQDLDRRATVPTVVVVCPGTPHRGPEREAESAALDARLRAGLRDLGTVTLLDVDGWSGGYRVDVHHDPVRDEIAGIPYTPAGCAALGTGIARAVHALSAPPFKVLVLDCDNTLWRGVCAEDGPDGVEIDDGRRELQRWAVELHDRGVLLALCSKNVEEDVDAVLAQHPGMLLRPEHIAARRVNWDAKPDNVAAIAAELGLGLDSVVFVDDNPVETAAVKAAHPSVLALTLPSDPADIAGFPSRVWAFDQPAVTGQDRDRAAVYRAARERDSSRASAGTLAEFIAGLELRIDVREALEADLARVSQLTQRTNQFNLNTVRRTLPALRALVASGARCWVVEVGDRFGDYGLVGAAITVRRGDVQVLETFVLSCRALGRGVEHAFLAEVARSQHEAGEGTSMEAKYVPSRRNVPVRRFFDSVLATGDAFTVVRGADGSALHSGPLEEFAKIAFRPDVAQDAELDGDAAPATVERDTGAESARHLARLDALAALAAELVDVDALDAAVRGARLDRTEAHGAPAAQDTGTAASWSEVWNAVHRVIGGLRGTPITPKTSVESLQLTSLEVVDAVAALRETVDDLDLTLFYAHRTLGDIVDAVAPARPERDSGGPGTGPSSSDGAPPVAKPAAPDVPPGGIAVVGLSGRYPGAADPEQLWRNLVAGLDSVGDAATRWGPVDHVDVNGRPDKTRTSAAGLIDGVDEFDALFFAIAPSEAETMDPQQRLFLQCAYHAIEDSGHTPASLGRDVGVYVASMGPDYALLSAAAALKGLSRYPNHDIYQIANRVSHFFDFTGPSMAIDTACSGSGVALQLACDAIASGSTSAALVGGVNLILHPARRIQYSQLGMLSPSGRCRPFGAGADGMISSEAVTAVLLRPLADALADGDHVYGVIRAVGTNSDGRTNGFTVPNPDAQAALVSATLRRAGVSPESIGYVEAHGTGTPLGDPVEIRGLTTAFGSTPAHGRTPVGSVKSNLGHTEAAAGLVGLTKVLLQLRHATLVPSLHADELNPHIDFEHSPFRVQREIAEWPARPGTPRRASLNTFGAGGVNVHVVVEEAPPTSRPAAEHGGRGAELIVLSAPDDDLLHSTCGRLLDFVAASGSEVDFHDVAHTLRVGRVGFDCRIALVARDAQHLVDVLGRVLEHGPSGLENAVGLVDDAAYGRGGSTSAIAGAFDGGPATVDTALGLARSGDLWRLGVLWTQGATLDWRRILPGTGRRTSLPTFPFRRTRHWLPDTPAPVHEPVEHRVEAGDDSTRRRQIRDGLWRRAASLAKMPADDIDRSADLGDYGFNSLIFLDLAGQLTDEFGVEVGAADLMTSRTIDAITEVVLARAGSAGPSAPRSNGSSGQRAFAVPRPADAGGQNGDRRPGTGAVRADVPGERVTVLVLVGAETGLSLVEEMAGNDLVDWVVLRERSRLPVLAEREREVDFEDYRSGGDAAKWVVDHHGPVDAVVDLVDAGATTARPAGSRDAGRTGVLVQVLAAHRRTATLRLVQVTGPRGGPGVPSASPVQVVGGGRDAVDVRTVEVNGDQIHPDESIATALRETVAALVDRPLPGSSERTAG